MTTYTDQNAKIQGKLVQKFLSKHLVAYAKFRTSFASQKKVSVRSFQPLTPESPVVKVVIRASKQAKSIHQTTHLLSWLENSYKRELQKVLGIAFRNICLQRQDFGLLVGIFSLILAT